MARISVRLTPRGGRDVVEGWDGDVLRVRVTAAPSEGEANEALIRLLAKELHVPPSRVSLVAGGRSRTKIVDIDGMTDEAVRAAL
jgi:uncharacterized protein (TIGR00251 family)